MNQLAYAVGGLLYSPATNTQTAEHILNNDWPCLTSVSLCLEDSITDAALPQAEKTLKDTLHTLRTAQKKLPLLFVRVRNPQHMRKVHAMLGEDSDVLTGYIMPKFDLNNCMDYLQSLRHLNRKRQNPLYAMPIIESAQVANIATRREVLPELREITDMFKKEILNIRVGGNDFCNLFGLRRHVDQTIYDVGPVRDILVDILNVFSGEYVVSGPVWEYYGESADQPWAQGLRRELALDRVNGFIGKTAIHPSQLPLIYDSLRVSRADAEDAERILQWNDTVKGVAAGSGGRMNEVKCHTRWAEKIRTRAQIYGIREE